MANQWMRGNGTNAVQGDEAGGGALLDNNIIAYLQDPLDRLLANYQEGCKISYTSASSVTIATGEVACANAGDTIHKMRQNTSVVALDLTTKLDTGSEANSTRYYVYAIGDADATTFTGIISASASAPTGANYTYFKQLGSFYNNSSGNIDEDSVNNVGAGCYMVKGTSDITTTSATLTDMTDMVITETFIAGDVLITFTAPMNVLGSGTGKMTIDADGSEKIFAKFGNPAPGIDLVIPICMQIKVHLTAGSHTIKVRWSVNNSFRQDVTRDGPRVLTCLIL